MKVEIKRSASKYLAKLPGKQYDKIRFLLLSMERHKSTNHIQNDGKLKGYPDRYKIRIGNYRIIYKTESETHIIITAIAHRKDIYNRLFGLL